MVMSLLNMVLGGFGKIIGLFMSADPNVRAAIAISLGAVPGALSRYYITIWMARWLGTAFPYGTFFINLTGVLVMGFFATFTLERAITSPELRLLIATGFLGAYTTFSTYALDTQALVKSGSYFLSLLYWLGSAFLGVVGCEIGSQIARRWG
jgi:fluoride exporter